MLVMTAMMACSSGGGGARRAPRPHALEACVGTLRELATALAEPIEDLMHEPIGRRPWAAGLSCAGLYREPACAEAWRAAFGAAVAPDSAAPDGMPATILAACARAYCPRLRAAPSACALDGGDGGASIARLVELDGAILEYEGVSPAEARAIAGRAKLFTSVSATVDSLPAAPAVERSTLTLVVDGDGALRTIDGPTDLKALAPRLRALATQGGELLLVAPEDVPKQRLMDVLTAARAEGVKDVLFQVQKP